MSRSNSTHSNHLFWQKKRKAQLDQFSTGQKTGRWNTGRRGERGVVLTKMDDFILKLMNQHTYVEIRIIVLKEHIMHTYFYLSLL